jgi:ABC-type amino acid transport substrate-binding protein
MTKANVSISLTSRVILGVVALMAQCVAGAQPLRYSVSTAWTMPYAQIEGGLLKGGILFDLGRALEAPLSAQVEFVVLPPNRQDAASLAGRFDLKCYLNAQWTTIPEHFVWSPSLFELADVIFGHASQVNPVNVTAIAPGASVSAVLGYIYPTLTPAFTSGQLKRDDSPDQEKVMLKVAAGRTPYGVADALALQWHQRNTDQHQTSSWRIPVSQHEFRCAVPKNGKIPATRILTALNGLKKSGKIEAILKRYR